MGSVRAKLGRGRDPLPAFVSMRPKLENDVPNFVEQSHGQFAGWLGPTRDPLTIDADPSRGDYRVGEIEPLPEVPEGRMHRRRSLLDSLEEKLKDFSNWIRCEPCSETTHGPLICWHRPWGDQPLI
ncbi:MAG: DUF1501 domain-containing protein [Planctomycetaceae bacterium]|nr:DUF1501 domain-containing protein [Planctomycetaceae bacterium]